MYLRVSLRRTTSCEGGGGQLRWCYVGVQIIAAVPWRACNLSLCNWEAAARRCLARGFNGRSVLIIPMCTNCWFGGLSGYLLSLAVPVVPSRSSRVPSTRTYYARVVVLAYNRDYRYQSRVSLITQSGECVLQGVWTWAQQRSCVVAL